MSPEVGRESVMATRMEHGTGPAGGEERHGHPPYLQHHYDTPQQQFDSGKLGMWIFLSTEVLFFGGLFVAYTVYRDHHPEIFLYAHQYLDKTLGGINTVVLICSSFTMAWAVRCAQLGRQRGLIVLLSLTLLCAFGFLGIKYVEYQQKWKHGLLMGYYYNPQDHATPRAEHTAPGTGGTPPASPASATAPVDQATREIQATPPSAPPAPVSPATPAEAGMPRAGTPVSAATDIAGAGGLADERSNILPAAAGPAGLAPEGAEGGHETVHKPANVHIFFGIYFAMTGLHGIHVIGGIIVISWLLYRSVQGHFNAEYFTPVDFVGLYWHLVDLIWIYLFPLLYLIH